MRKLFAAITIIAVAILAVPIVIVVLTSFSSSFAPSFPPQGYSLKWYHAFFKEKFFTDALFNVSLPLATASGATAVVIAFLASAWIRFGGGRREAMWLSYLSLPLLVPHVIVGVAIYLALAALRMPASIALLFLAHVLIALPYSLRIIHSTIAGIDDQYLNATFSLGGGVSTFLGRVLLPMSARGCANAFVFGFVVSFADINVSLFLAPPDTATFPVQLYSKILWDSDPSVAAGSAIQILLISVMTLFVFRMFSTGR